MAFALQYLMTRESLLSRNRSHFSVASGTANFFVCVFRREKLIWGFLFFFKTVLFFLFFYCVGPLDNLWRSRRSGSRPGEKGSNQDARLRSSLYGTALALPSR